ncbi:MAG: S41 family peptidase, partial [Clostridia bacterium]|nr:S41 family peptidase [Clostridia bacterium]
DYELATIIGTKTFGKGIMQTYYSMERYGFDGVVKLTSNQYLPPCGISYHNIGIKPSEGFDIELDEAASNINVLIREDAVDNQIQAAVELFKSQNN